MTVNKSDAVKYSGYERNINLPIFVDVPDSNGIIFTSLAVESLFHSTVRKPVYLADVRPRELIGRIISAGYKTEMPGKPKREEEQTYIEFEIEVEDSAVSMPWHKNTSISFTYQKHKHFLTELGEANKSFVKIRDAELINLSVEFNQVVCHEDLPSDPNEDS